MGFKLNINTKIFIAGHTGLIGSAFKKYFEQNKFNNLITKNRSELDLTSKNDTQIFFKKYTPELVIMAAGKVGGIIQNRDYPFDFMNENLSIQHNVFNSAKLSGVKKLLFFGSSCMYPKDSLVPLKETQIFNGNIEPTSIAYATSKFTGIQMCQAINRQFGSSDFISVIPNSVYGPNDNFDLQSSHVLSALIRRFHEAKLKNDLSVTLWGTGSPKREFVYSDDLVDACILILNCELNLHNFPINIGQGSEISIKELSKKISKIVNYNGDIKWDISKPDGAPRKLLDNTKMKSIGWTPKTDLDQGIKLVYEWYKKNLNLGLIR